MSGATTKAVATLALRNAKDLLSSLMHTEEWDLCGEIHPEKTGDQTWMVSTPKENPLRLVHLPTGRMLVVPFARMETDFASVPKFLQRLGGKVFHFKPTDYKLSAFFHDQVFAAGGVIVVFARRRLFVKISMRQANAILFVCMECEGATWGDGIAYHSAVTLFGRRAWTKCRKENAQWPPLFEGGSA
jgi:hypothetical protein